MDSRPSHHNRDRSKISSHRRPEARQTLIAIALAWALAAPSIAQEARSFFDWFGPATTVVAATSLGQDGRFTEVRVLETLRGEPLPGQVLRVDVRHANRNRDRMLDPKALRLDTDVDYLLILEPVKSVDENKPPSYRLVRGVDGARELVREGREAQLSALKRLIEIQDARSDELKWHRLSAMLEETNPLLIQTALQQFLKFRRGDDGLVLSVVPLLDHPRPDVRADAARLLGQIVHREGGAMEVENAELVRSELVSRATRDESPGVRVAAVEALAEFPADSIDEVLEQIARADPEQQVRYAAELIRREHRLGPDGP
jgi:hypothetical protein